MKKLAAGNKGTGAGISIPTRTSPRKVQQVPRPLYEKLKSTDDITGNIGQGTEKESQVPNQLPGLVTCTEVPAANKGKRNAIGKPTSTTPTNVQHQSRPLEDKLKGKQFVDI